MRPSRINRKSFGLFYKLALDIHGQNKIVDLDFNLDAHYPNNGHTKCMHQSKCHKISNKPGLINSRNGRSPTVGPV